MGTKLFRKLIFRLFLKLPDIIVVNSKEFKKEYKEKFNLKTYCIYNPLDIKFIKKSKEKLIIIFRNFNNLKIIFIGRLVDQKILLHSLKLSKLLNKIKFKVIIIGKGVYLGEIKNYTKA